MITEKVQIGQLKTMEIEMAKRIELKLKIIFKLIKFLLLNNLFNAWYIRSYICSCF